MIVIIQPSVISGIVNAPASKSCMQRACALALLHAGETVILNAGKSNDDNAALNIIQDLGAIITDENEKIIVKSDYPLQGGKSTIHCGESGLSLRMFTPIAAILKREITITGAGSLLQRPVDFFSNVLPQLNVAVFSKEGKLPIKVYGPLVSKEITIDGSLSSQFLTGLLLAFSKSCTEPVTIHVNDLASKPYIDLTLQMMHHFGRVVENDSFQNFIIYPEKSNLNELQSSTDENKVIYKVEADWSSASFLLVAGAIAGKDVVIRNLNINSSQADKKIIEVLQIAGADLKINDDEVIITKKELKGFQFDASDCPDLFPPLVALASFCKGQSVIKGVHRLQHKESNRAKTLRQEFTKLGVNIFFVDDEMHVQNTAEIKGGVVDSHNDHRIAMACAVAACGASGPVTIQHAEAINKSYPDFFEHLQLLNVSLQKT
ncbi:3-phosphoshikimate 1-carboxyvinyltransferase [soil metagenome]